MADPTSTTVRTHLEPADALIDAGIATGLVMAASRGGRRVDVVMGHDRPADDADAVTLDRDQLFNVGSVSKCMTGALLASVIADGLADLDDPIQHYLPRYADADDTIRQLATHTAGYAFKQIEAWPNHPSELDEFRDRVYGPRNKLHTPVQDMNYWSTGYFVLMELIEAVCASPIETVATERFFTPLGMARTTFLGSRADALGRVLPYHAKEERRLTELATAPPLGETGIWTTANDLLRFGESLIAGSHWQPLALQLMMTDHSTAGHQRTLGFWLKPTDGDIAPFGTEMSPQAIGHPGYTGCFLGVDPTHDFCVAITSPNLRIQADFGNYTRLSSAMWQALAAR